MSVSKNGCLKKKRKKKKKQRQMYLSRLHAFDTGGQSRTGTQTPDILLFSMRRAEADLFKWNFP